MRGIDLEQAFRDKEEKNKQRTWKRLEAAIGTVSGTAFEYVRNGCDEERAVWLQTAWKADDLGGRWAGCGQPGKRTAWEADGLAAKVLENRRL